MSKSKPKRAASKFSIVSIIRQEDYSMPSLRESLVHILQESGILGKVAGKQILIKPNCTNAYPPEQGKTTHPAVADALISILEDNSATVTIGESCSVGSSTIDAYHATGIFDIARKHHIKLIDFKKSKYAYHQLDGLLHKGISLPQELQDFDCIISFAKLKTNYSSQISCSIKNLKGLLKDDDKKMFHRIGLMKSIVDMYSCVSSIIPIYAIVDGIIGNELNDPKHAGLLIASTDPVACDSICSHIMGLNPDDIEYLSQSHKLNLGELDIKRINSYGYDFRRHVATPFKSTVPGLQKMAERFGITIFDESPCTGCQASLYASLERVMKSSPDLLSKDICISIGSKKDEHPEQYGRKMIYYGSCQKQPQGTKDAYHVCGCPPRNAELVEALKQLKKSTV